MTIYIDFAEIISTLSSEEQKEFQDVQSVLNSKPDDRLNQIIYNHLDLSIRLIKDMANSGLSILAKDYYIYQGFGGVPTIKESPNGLIKRMTPLLSKAGFKSIINTGVVFKNYEHCSVKRNGQFDEINVTNSIDMELGGAGSRDDILAPYCMILIFNLRDELLSKKLTIFRHQEYINAIKTRKKGEGMHAKYPVPMAEKMPLRRAAKQMMATYGFDQQLNDALDRHDDDFEPLNPEYEPENEERTTAPAKTEKLANSEQIQNIKNKIIESGASEELVLNYLAKKDINCFEEIPQSKIKLILSKLGVE